MEFTKIDILALGTAQMSLADEPITGKLHNKTLALLAYLAVEARPHSREHLSDLFWPDLPKQSARSNLRKTVFRLRQAVGMEIILSAAADSLLLDPAAYRLDLAEFTRPSERDLRCEQAEARSELYRGPFLDGMALENCPDFTDWVTLKRETCHRHALGLLETLSAYHEHNGQSAKALRFANRTLELEPWDEGGHRRVMRLLAQSGQTAAALAQFEACRRLLKRELDALPDEETSELCRRIKAGALQPESAQQAAARPAERRQVTALYCGFPISDTVDAEEIAERWHTTQGAIHAVIRQFDGHVAQSHGGAVLGYFGYPAAHEDAARSAVRAALALRELSDPGHPIRIGVHTGMIVTSTELPDSMGLTSAFAIRLRDAQHPVLISEATRRLVAGYFHLEPAGLRQIDNLPQPVPVYRVDGESGARHRLEAAERLTPFVGRASEIDALAAWWREVSHNASRIVVIEGEAGIGKSRLVQRFRESLGDGACAQREMRCFPEFSQSAFHPLIAMIELVCGFAAGDTPESKLGKLARHLQAHCSHADAETLPLLAQLLSLPAGEPSDRVPDPRKLGAILLDLLEMLAARQPTLYIVEDLHWADPSSLELLARFAERRSRSPILMLLTTRPNFYPRPGQDRFTRLPLQPLANDQVAAMLGYIGHEMSPETIRDIVVRADGIPLFAEEMAKLAQDGLKDIPATLRDLLTMKLDGTGAAKRSAQLAASIGREFDLDLLREIAGAAPALESRLDELRDAGLVFQRSGKIYQFRHALIQEAAYQSQTRADRQAAHRHIADALCRRFPEIVAAEPEIVARHLTLGSQPAAAIEYWIQAGKRACQRAANHEAIEHFNAGLRLLPLLPADAQADRMEFALQVGRGVVLHAVQGFSSSQAAEAFARAMELCGKAASPEAFQTIWGIWVGRMEHFPSALEFAQQLPHIARQLDDPVLLVQAHYVLSNNSFFLGAPESSREHARAAISFYRPDYHAKLVEQFGEDSAVTSGVFLSWSLWLLGFPEQALRAGADALELARQTGHPHSIGFALSANLIVRRWMGQSDRVLSLAKETIELAMRHNFPLWLGGGVMMQGWAQVMLGRADGIAYIQQGVAAMRASMNASTVLFLAVLADAHMHLKQDQAALEVLTEALQAVEILGERHFEAELYRLKGECLLRLSAANAAHAEAYFERALEISRRQAAKSLELRAALSLARHFDRQESLSELYAWFSEGFDSLDLCEARDLLDSAARCARPRGPDRSTKRRLKFI